MLLRPPSSALFPYTTLFRSNLGLLTASNGGSLAILGTTVNAGSGTLEAQSGSTLYIGRSEEHTSELQSLRHLVCRLLLEKKKKLTLAGSGSCIGDRLIAVSS